jgi:predicted house-cleaning noncanonical NTP pyrophosphatase (MazG superfamily)
MKRVYYRKLIRDKVPKSISRQGGFFSVRILTQRIFLRQLLLKVGEEASALPHSKTRRELVAEIADVLDVVDEILRVKRISRASVKTAQRANAKRKGGFRKRIFITWASDTGYETNERKGKR